MKNSISSNGYSPQNGANGAADKSQSNGKLRLELNKGTDLNASGTDPQNTGASMIVQPAREPGRSLRFYPSRLPVTGKWGDKLQSHLELLSPLLAKYPLRGWQVGLHFLQGQQSSAAAEATENAAARELRLRHEVGSQRREKLAKDWSKLNEEAQTLRGETLKARRQFAKACGTARLLLVNTELPGAVRAVEEALEARLPSTEVFAGGLHWLPAANDEQSGNRFARVTRVKGGFQSFFARVGEQLFTVSTALVCGMLSGLTLGTVTGFLRPSDLKAPEYTWPSLLIAWAIGTFIEANAARAAHDAAWICAHSWNAQKRGSDEGNPSWASTHIGGKNSQHGTIVLTAWLFIGLTIAHGMGLHHLAHYAANRLQVDGAPTSEFPLWLFFVAGGVTTACFMGSHALDALRKAREVQRRAALRFLRWRHRQSWEKEEGFVEVLQCAHELDALAHQAKDLSSQRNDLESRSEATFNVSLTDGAQSALRAVDDEARGERTRAEGSLEALIEALEPLTIGKGGQK